jgi:hypothetical protein
MAVMDVRMEAIVRGSDGETLGRVWGMLLGKRERDVVLTHLLVEGGAFARDALLPFEFVGHSSGQELALRVPKGEALTGTEVQAEEEAPEGTIVLHRNDPIHAIDARLGQIRGFYADEAGKISDLLVNDEVSRQLSMVSIRAVEEINSHRVVLNSRIGAMGELLKPPQAFYQPVELRGEEELFGHGHGAAKQH